MQIVESTGTVMSPYMDFPQLLSLLLRILHEGSPQQRKEVMKVRLSDGCAPRGGGGHVCSE